LNTFVRAIHSLGHTGAVHMARTNVFNVLHTTS
jgi:hypothetical protein